MRFRSPATRFRLGTTVLCLVMLGSSAQAAPGLEYATRVAHVRAPVSDGFAYELGCEFASGAVREHMSVVSVEEPGGFMSSSVSIHARESNQGRLMQIGDERFVEEERVERKDEPHAFTRWGAVGFSGPATAHLAVAVWGGDVSSCYAIIDDYLYLPMTMYPGTYAFYAGPETFTGGAFYQDGGTQVSVARVFTRGLTGGPLFSTYVVSDNDPPRSGDGFITSDDPDRLNSVSVCGWCNYARPHPTVLIAGTLLATELGGQPHNQLWVINPP